MYITTSQCVSYKNDSLISPQVNDNIKKHNSNSFNNDLFIPQNNNSKQVSFNGIFSFVSKILGFDGPKLPDDTDPSLSLHEKLSIGVKKEWDEDIPPEKFKGIMSPAKLKAHLKNLTTENFICTEENKDNCIYNTDLDCITTFSYNGRECIQDILDEVAKYANYYKKKTGKNFVLAFTDNDSIEGLKHAVRRVANNNDRYKNIDFVPGMKISFIYKVSDKRCENGKLLVYGVNPFSDNVNDFVLNTLARRQDMIVDFISGAAELYRDAHFTEHEFYSNNNMYFSKDLGQSNLYSKIREYMMSKRDKDLLGLQIPPDEIYKLSEGIFSSMDTIFNGSNDFENFCILIAGSKENANSFVNKVLDKYSTRYDPETNEIFSASENIYSDFINCMKLETPRPIMALSAPYYLSHHFEHSGDKIFPNVVNFMKSLQKYSAGMLLGFESASPAYDLDKELTANKDALYNFNTYIKENTNLQEVGGSFVTRNIINLPVDVD